MSLSTEPHPRRGPPAVRSLRPRALSGDAACCGRAGHRRRAYSALEQAELPDAAVSRRLAAATRPRSPSSARASVCWTSVPAAASMSCCRRSASGPTGRAIGLDMTDEMLALAQRNAAEAGATNVEFLKGTIEAIPLPADSVDVVISNCVINLAADKPAVFREIARVLRPGGRMGVTDIVAEDCLTAAQRASAAAYRVHRGRAVVRRVPGWARSVGLTDVAHPDPRRGRRDGQRHRPGREAGRYQAPSVHLSTALTSCRWQPRDAAAETESAADPRALGQYGLQRGDR